MTLQNLEQHSRTRAAVASRLSPVHHGGRVRPSDVEHVGRRPDGGAAGPALALRLAAARAGRYLDELPYRVWVLCGDSEMAEGSMWEALDNAAYYRLDSLTVIVEVNRLGQRGPTELGWDLDAYAARVEGFGCHAITIDGHDLNEIDKALAHATEADRPTVILARTRKGRGFPEVDNREGWHGRALPTKMADRAIAELGGERHLVVSGPRPEGRPVQARPSGKVSLPATSKALPTGSRKPPAKSSAPDARLGVTATATS